MVENKKNKEKTEANNNEQSSVERFTAFLSEKLQDQDAVIISDYYALGTSQLFVDSGIIGIVQAVTDGLLVRTSKNFRLSQSYFANQPTLFCK